MRINVLSALAICFVLFSCNQDNKHKKGDNSILPDITNTDDKTMKTKEFVNDFDEIEVSSAIDADVVKSDHEKVVISAPAYILEDVEVKFEGGKLSIGYKPGLRIINESRVKATIYAKDFKRIEGNGAAEITLKDKFTQEKVEVVGSGAAEIKGDLEANDFKIDVSGASSYKGNIWAINLNVQAASSAELNLKGKTKNILIDASSAAEVAASDVISEVAKIDASSSSEVSLGVISSVDAEASSAAEIKILKKGDVKILRKEESSSGSISFQ